MIWLQKPADLIDDLSWLIFSHIKLNRHEMMRGLSILTLREKPLPLSCDLIENIFHRFLYRKD